MSNKKEKEKEMDKANTYHPLPWGRGEGGSRRINNLKVIAVISKEFMLKYRPK